MTNNILSRNNRIVAAKLSNENVTQNSNDLPRNTKAPIDCPPGSVLISATSGFHSNNCDGGEAVTLRKKIPPKNR